ncbi:MAG TPA: sigma-54 dependent transcriptional regulator [bacterium]|nr:sigma-54 dependent transcriptional regulator [bacterium]
MASVLVVDDEPKITVLLEGELTDAGHAVTTATDGAEALRLLSAKRFDVVLTDLRMGAVDGLEVLRRAKAADAATVVLVMTAYATVQTAVAAMKEGASDYLEKPLHLDKVRLVIERSLEQRRLADENRVLRARVSAGDVGAETMVRGKSAAMREVMGLVEKVSPTEATVLLSGESGTGKEVVARAVHELSARRDGQLVAVNCAALSETLLESELFGHEKGAFTDAVERRLGWFEVAAGGTIFLDEIGELKPSTQAKLLRVLEDRRFHRLGGSGIIEADVRVVAATNRDLEAEIEEGGFREDLFYRLNVFPVHLPPLRDRLDDLDELTLHFLDRTAYDGPGLDAEARKALGRYDWPGNLRELRNVIERAVILAGSGPISPAELHLPERRRAAPAPAAVDPAGTLSENEERLVRDALEKAGGNKSKAARILGITRRALYGRLERYGIEAGGED